MKSLTLPIFCQPFGPEAVLGRLAGTAVQFVAPTATKAAQKIAAYVQQRLRHQETLYFLELEHYTLRALTISLTPSYQEGTKVYPLRDALDIPVYAITGPNGQGSFECYLPQLEQGFYYYQAQDLDTLMEHFARDHFHRMPPEAIYAYLRQGTPWLETISVRVPRPSDSRTVARDPYAGLEVLPATAEHLPQPRNRDQIRPATTWERETEVRRLVNELTDTQRHVILMGKEGVGKGAILTEAIRRSRRQEKSQERPHTFWRSRPPRILAKARYLGEWQQICEALVQELQQVRGVLWMEDLVSLATTGGEGPEDSMAAFFLPFLRQGDFQLVATLTPGELTALRRLLPGFVDYFQVISVSPLDEQATAQVLSRFNEQLDHLHKIRFTEAARWQAQELLKRFVRYEQFPGKAIRFMSDCAAAALREGVTEIDAYRVTTAFSIQTGLPEPLLRDDIPLDGDDLQAFFDARIKGQAAVVHHLCQLIKVFKSGLNDPEKPVASLIFAGPTGVGKTATAKALASYLFGLGPGHEALVRLDMSEFQHPAQVYRLIGPEGKLVRHLRERPFSVVLFDEIEKAHPVIFDALLTVLDEGYLVDTTGRETDFRSAVIILTTNLGAQARPALGFAANPASQYDSDIRRFFRPEFVNRIDQVLVFQPLGPDTVAAITRQELAEVAAREGVVQRGLKLRFTEALVAHLAQAGFDARYGARPLQREIERLLVAPLARLLLQQPTLKNCGLAVDFREGMVHFDPA